MLWPLIKFHIIPRGGLLEIVHIKKGFILMSLLDLYGFKKKVFQGLIDGKVFKIYEFGVI